VSLTYLVWCLVRAAVASRFAPEGCRCVAPAIHYGGNVCSWCGRARV
jgi:hypothetical protein